MKKQPTMIKELVTEFMSYGWNKVQAKSLAWIEFFEQKDNKIDAWRGSRNLTWGDATTIDCHCLDCKDGGQLLPGTARMWLQSHKNHNTKTIKIR